jgi:hypothetical protein
VLEGHVDALASLFSNLWERRNSLNMGFWEQIRGSGSGSPNPRDDLSATADVKRATGR